MAFYKRKPQEVEAHVFNGSSTGVGQVTKWMETGVWKDSEIHTRDIRNMDVNGTQAFPGDYIVKVGDQFRAMSPQDFSDLYEPVTDEDRLPGDYKAKNVVMGDKVEMWGKEYLVKGVKVSGDDTILELDDGSNVQIRGETAVKVTEVRA
ncbi:conserved hypothetical protein [Salmonella phage PVPSE1]|uniref:Uncharacterized protein 111 n=4 Tax=Seunavirus TaxID=1914851 RepID=G3BLX6_9CAUD|nr:hypothetical protein PVP-SE1_gp110 [Salmonella phage PVPSE1]YP_009149012.1 hypothetical protein ACQ19_gp216 [Salmonella phage SSE121]ADP02506.1 conserved hypothetical protein [Salmonella phage PVPSE1]AFU63857.1 hypothetical protein [Salmonella phage SSE121]